MKKLKKKIKILIEIKIPNAKKRRNGRKTYHPFILNFEKTKGLKLNLESK